MLYEMWYTVSHGLVVRLSFGNGVGTARFCETALIGDGVGVASVLLSFARFCFAAVTVLNVGVTALVGDGIELALGNNTGTALAVGNGAETAPEVGVASVLLSFARFCFAAVIAVNVGVVLGDNVETALVGDGVG